MENKKPRVKKTTIDDKIKNAISKILNVQRPIGVNISYTSKRIRFVEFVQETEKKVTTKIQFEGATLIAKQPAKTLNTKLVETTNNSTKTTVFR